MSKQYRAPEEIKKIIDGLIEEQTQQLSDIKEEEADIKARKRAIKKQLKDFGRTRDKPLTFIKTTGRVTLAVITCGASESKL